jgi:hypothetical protein
VTQHHPCNDWYEELCALAAIGEVSPSEFEELQQHLAECSDCTQLYGDFRRITSHDLAMMAASKRADQTDEAADALDERELLSHLLDRAKHERAKRDTTPTPRLPDLEQPRLRERGLRVMMWLQRPALSYGSLALILCLVAAAGAYRLKEAELMPAFEGLNSQLQHWKGQAETTEAQEKSTSQSLEQALSARDTLQKSLAEAQTKYAELQNQDKQLEAELAAARAQITQGANDVDAAKAVANGKEQQLAQLQTRLQDAIQRTQEQERIANDLRSRLQGTEQAAELASGTPEGQGFNDADAKQLFGARDLHIVDVYDVDTNGKTRRSYGRVYYVEKKLLVFYAFDLEDKKRNRTAAGFQAWGYREANEVKPESLGLFNVDDPSINRWVLKVSNPRVLERIEAVYVTLEPPNGSPSPRGRRLLYANLVVPPNHP